MGFIILFSAVLTSMSAFAATTNVILGPGTTFNPASITVNVGDTVHWDNSTASAGFHSVVPNGGTDPTANTGQTNVPGSPWTYDFVFNTSGAFPYRCGIHSLMTGIVNVAPGPSPSITPTLTESPTITVSPTNVPPGSTVTDTPTPSPTATPTKTATPGDPPIQLFDRAPELLFAPNPVKVGEKICLYSNSRPAESVWDIYNTASERVAHLGFMGSEQECWDTTKLAPGLYYIKAEWLLTDGRVKKVKQKVVLWR